MPRAPLPGDLAVDVAVVGGGLTGLWTAYYLATADPSLRIAVLEKEVVGFGASGRNGGWCSSAFGVPRSRLVASHGREATVATQRRMFEAVDEVGRVCEAEGIDAHFAKGGSLAVATTALQAERVRASIAEAHALGFTEADYRWLGPEEARACVEVAGGTGAEYSPHCAALHPGRLTRGLSRTAEGRGVRVFEGTEAKEIGRGAVRTTRGTVRAEIVVRALEGYASGLRRHRRLVLPLQIFMIATEPLPASFWDEVGWRDRECVNDARRVYLYAQRTADDRIAVGAAGIRYHFGSGMPEAPGEVREHEGIRRALAALFPGSRDAEITHRWAGYFGIRRDWHASMGFRPEDGLAWADGYAGDGVSTANVAGRTIRDLVLGRDSDLVRLPWVQRRSRRWEPEPLRWLGTTLGFRAMAGIDRAEQRRGRPSRFGGVVERVLGLESPPTA